jgi:hypothetical protein
VAVVNGPYGSPSQAHATARHAYQGCAYAPLRHSALSLLMTAVEGTGVRLGAYDRDIMVWLAAAEPQVAAVVAGLVARAHQAGQETGA